jgi:tRNA dimethylallyltransferase
MPAAPIAIVGATATGKTALAIELALRFDGEIVNADSRQVYTGMDIGTAKPTPAERRSVRHWVIDVADPREPFTLALYLDLARAALADIASRGRRAFVVGGTGQYLWALLEGWKVPRVPPDPALRADLESLAARDGVDALARILLREDPIAAETIDRRNPRRLIRAIEVTRLSGRPFSAWRGKPSDGTKPARDGQHRLPPGLRSPRRPLHPRRSRRAHQDGDAPARPHAARLVPSR